MTDLDRFKEEAAEKQERYAQARAKRSREYFEDAVKHLRQSERIADQARLAETVTDCALST